MPSTPNTTPVVATFTAAHRLEALLEHTADLDKAQTLQAAIPEWLASADLPVVQALRAAFQQSDLAHRKAAQVLGRLKPLDVFCKEQLTRVLKDKWAINVDVERDTLEIVRRSLPSTTVPHAIGTIGFVNTSSRSLLHAAMENFTEDEALPGGLPESSTIKIKEQAQKGSVITAAHFAKLARELDLGALYQRHIDEVFALPAKPGAGATVGDRATAADIRRLKLINMEVAAHIAYLKKDLSDAGYKMLLSVIAQDLPAAQTKGAVFDGSPVMWQGLTIHDACICGALIFTKTSIDTAPKAKCVVYLPNDPRRPVYEYASLDEFKLYLTLKLQSKSYRAFFARQFLHGHDKADFFAEFDKDKTLGTLTATPATCLSDFFFSAFVSKAQEEARILAVPTEEVDEEQRFKTVQQLFDGALMLLNVASFFVPVLGLVMTAAAVVDMAGEVYEGVEDWAHGERTKAVSHLLNVVENVAQMAAFAVGGKVVSRAWRQSLQEHTAFFDDFEAVTRAGGKRRLWKPDLQAYRQASPLPKGLRPDSNGLYKQGERTSIVMDGAVHQVVRNEANQRWQIKHAQRQDAYEPAVERNVEGGWRHVHEHAHEWPDSAYALKRTAPRLNSLTHNELTQLADITGMTCAELYRLHEGGLPLPPRLSDCAERIGMNRNITALVAAIQRDDLASTAFLPEQLHALPQLPGWPEKRFIEVRDAQDKVVARFPQTAPLNDDVNSVHVSQAQMSAGKLLDTVISGLYPHEVERLIGPATTGSKSRLLLKKIAAWLQADRRPLLDALYENYDGAAAGESATLHEQAPDLPVRVNEALLADASARDRHLLRESKILGVDLARQVAQARFEIRQDRAVTGLYAPEVATADTDTLTLGLMGRVQAWDDGYRLELRQGSSTGALLNSAGKTDAPARGIIVKTSRGYEVTQGSGNVSSTLVSETLLGSILDVLPATQRTRMGLAGDDALDAVTLRSRLARAGTSDLEQAGRVLRGERSEVAKHLSACVQADPPVAHPYARSLIRKVRKLYPLFSDAQVSSFLDEAGSTQMMRVNRLKELGQQLKKLQAVLLAWREDEAAMRKLPGQINDIRISRRQVAATLEKCWRRVAPPRWPQNQPFTSLRLERNPVGPLPTLAEHDVAHVRHLSIKDMQAGDELAYFLKPFKGLVNLELDRNRLTRLPEVLSHMPDLRHLSLNDNQLVLTEHTLRKLADLRELRTLGLSGNRLGASPDVSKMSHLQSLFLANTYATELPVGLSRLGELDRVDLRGNHIRDLPSWLFDLPRRFADTINLRHNPLSVSSLVALGNYRGRTGAGMGFLENDNRVINEQVARDLWMDNPAEATYAARNRTWLALKNEPHATGFFQLLAEVGSSADSHYVREDMTRRVWQVIEATQSDAALRDQLFSMAVKSNCADSAATIFSNLEVAVNIDAVVRQSAHAHDQADRLLSLGRRLFRQDYLAKIARERATADPKLDPVEVELAYRVNLAERLDLVGQPRHMRYSSASGVTVNDLEAAYNRVVTAEVSPELLNYLSQRTFWIDFLRQHHGKQFIDLAEPFHTRMETAFDNQATLGTDYRAQVDGIATELQQGESRLLKRLTEEAMKAEELKTCFVLD
ncbi:hypothetical protein NTD84_26525 [Pseudomonas sp. 14P_8.1_Bac3]|uniref:NEL-type E3 ubiquitin ligase domain-containing protein n=1 Tax=Pseudomonas sp. 14P_8.1_Bac3 TaxID=2971621 RepID=UPI0021C77686|nr:NEL-type E3 ubiquitin ligase domain-containing protein [Pseudomonas sp. 14P_8.1_Bac3]MCU1763254.1 hypothetical protein [Pseudomonas sp. 14P_8.1_Bac3]